MINIIKIYAGHRYGSDEIDTSELARQYAPAHDNLKE